MCTDLRLVKLTDYCVSARTLDFAFELGSTVQVVPRGQAWTATKTSSGPDPLKWTNTLGFVGMTAFGFDAYFADGLNESGLSVGTLWLPETNLPFAPPAAATAPALDFINLAGWFLGTCSTVAEVKSALETVAIWNAPVKDLWPAGKPTPDQIKPLLNWAFTEHLAIHDAQGNDLVIEFVDGSVNVYDNHVGVLTNSPVYPWHITNLRNYIGLTNVEDKPINLMGMPVTATGNGTGLIGMPGDVTPPSRFIRATVLSEVSVSATSVHDAVNQAFHSLDLVSVPRHLAASGDYTQWYVVRDHGNLTYYVRSYDGWTTDAHDLRALKVNETGTQSNLPLPTA